MSNKPKRRPTSRRNRRLLISAVAIFIVAMSVLAYIGSTNQKQPDHQPGLKDSSTYFAISDLAGLYKSRGNTSDQNATMVLIEQFAFKFTPVGGDANDVRIFAEGFTNPLKTDWEGILIPNGTSIQTGDIMTAFPIPSFRESDGVYTLKIRILAREADGDVMLNFTTAGPEKNLFPIA